METVAVLGPPCSGTTAVTGLVALMGYDPCGPHYATDDGENTLEPHDLHSLLDKAVRIDRDEFVKIDFPDLEAWRETKGDKIVVKHPFLALFDVPWTKIIVKRRLDLIEGTRQRRKWAPMHGELGARDIYRRLERVSEGIVVDFERLRSDPMPVAERLAGYLGCKVPDEESVRAWIISPR